MLPSEDGKARKIIRIRESMRRATRYGLIGGLALLAVGWLTAVTVLVVNEEDYVFGGARRLDVTGALPPDSLGLSWDTVRVSAADGVGILLLEVGTDPDAPWVIFFHGSGASLGSTGMVDRYEFLRETGFNVLAPEYRGYGLSQEVAPTEEGVYADARAAWSHLRSKGVEPGRILLYGFSLGSGPAVQLATEKDAAGLVTEGAFISIPAWARAEHWWLPAELVMKNRFANLKKVDRIRVPWLLLHGRRDESVPLRHGEALAAAAGARLVTLEGRHRDAVLSEPDRAREALERFWGEVRPP